MKRGRLLHVMALGLVAAAYAGSAPTGIEGLDLAWWTLDGGGVLWSASDQFELSGTIGQPDAGTMSGGDFTVSGGFWFPLAPADCNVDGGVDLYDYSAFEACMSGPDGVVPEPFCSCFDLDGDGNVDLEDLAELQCSFSG